MTEQSAQKQSRIALGTVAFGLDYGISNHKGQVQQQEVARILEYAGENGIDTLDTAAAYGESETVLGILLEEHPCDFSIVSKLPPKVDNTSVDQAINASLKRLGVQRSKAFLAHDMESFKNPLVREGLQQAKEQGRIQQYGVSLYYPEEVHWLLEKDIDFDIVQFPWNVFDQRFRPLLPLLKAKGVEIHTRSAFLQGLFFLEAQALPEHFTSVADKLASLKDVAMAAELSLPTLLLNYALAQQAIDKVVIGVASLEELRENVDASRHMKKVESIKKEIDAFAVDDENILLPFRWRTT
ncbi:MAG: hypothetical protein CMH60_06390 [Myxococcales bacterium]|nr:hypothetical protein [Myxococcales bacterium]